MREGEVRPGAAVRVGKSVFRIESVDGSSVVPISENDAFGELVGASLEMRQVYAILERVALTKLARFPVSLDGPKGSPFGTRCLRATALYRCLLAYLNTPYLDVNSNDTIAMIVELSTIEVSNSNCVNEMTDSGWEYECGWVYVWLVEAFDVTTDKDEYMYVYQSGGNDATPNGDEMWYAYGAVMESYNDQYCEPDVTFSNIILEANTVTNPTSFNPVTYNPAVGPAGGGSSNCVNGVSFLSNTSTKVY